LSRPTLIVCIAALVAVVVIPLVLLSQATDVVRSANTTCRTDTHEFTREQEVLAHADSRAARRADVEELNRLIADCRHAVAPIDAAHIDPDVAAFLRAYPTPMPTP
jgi:hypothetical protein